jgi:hypothetical protein
MEPVGFAVCVWERRAATDKRFARAKIDVCVGAVVSGRLVRVLLVAAVRVLAWMRTPASQRRRTTVTANPTVSGSSLVSMG